VAVNDLASKNPNIARAWAEAQEFQANTFKPSKV
jgi:hypothetical protein